MPGSSSEARLPYLGFNSHVSSAAWKLHYYQWAMQIFEQYNISEGACQFALAALEQVDEALGPQNDSRGEDPLNKLATSFKGQLWEASSNLLGISITSMMLIVP